MGAESSTSRSASRFSAAGFAGQFPPMAVAFEAQISISPRRLRTRGWARDADDPWGPIVAGGS
eukprot:8188661-Pyramimonas_sp.AAC.1